MHACAIEFFIAGSNTPGIHKQISTGSSLPRICKGYLDQVGLTLGPPHSHQSAGSLLDLRDGLGPLPSRDTAFKQLIDLSSGSSKPGQRLQESEESDLPLWLGEVVP